MSADCKDGCGRVGEAPIDRDVRRILWIVLSANAAMFAIETVGGHAAGSLSLQADALDFGADAATYGVTLWAAGKAASIRARAALLKSAAMLAMGLAIGISAAFKIVSGAPPEAAPMGVIGALALAVNCGAVVLLRPFRDGDANIRSVWLCSRNDAFGNVLVILAAAATAWTLSPWSDLAVGLVMCALFLGGAWSVFEQARRESQDALRESRA